MTIHHFEYTCNSIRNPAKKNNREVRRIRSAWPIGVCALGQDWSTAWRLHLTNREFEIPNRRGLIRQWLTNQAVDGKLVMNAENRASYHWSLSFVSSSWLWRPSNAKSIGASQFTGDSARSHLRPVQHVWEVGLRYPLLSLNRQHGRAEESMPLPVLGSPEDQPSSSKQS